MNAYGREAMTPDKVEHTKADRGPKSAASGSRARPAGPPAPRLTAALTVFGLLLALGGWLLYGALNRPLTTPADPAELTSLDAQLVKIQKTAVPIAEAFATQSPTSPIDIAAYRSRVTALRDLVDSTNDLAATSPDALEIRDLVLTGGAQVVAGMQLALDAAAANDASATAAAAQMDEGLANLTAARTKLDLLLGRLKPA
jgi:hypothetical protein